MWDRGWPARQMQGEVTPSRPATYPQKSTKNPFGGTGFMLARLHGSDCLPRNQHPGTESNEIATHRQWLTPGVLGHPERVDAGC
jgi:hypothetical protein